MIEVPRVVLFDRDGTLVVNVPYNGDPDQVELRPTAVEAVDHLRSRGIRIGIVSNQSGVGRGYLGLDAVWSVNRRLEQLLGPMDGWFICPHAPEDGCCCRKPLPTLVLDALQHFGIGPSECVLIGDQGSDLQAAQAAGVHAILVPSPDTRTEDVRAATASAITLLDAVQQSLRRG